MMMLNRKACSGSRHKMQFVPMVDCVFLLLVFFLVAAQVRPIEADYDTNMPTDGPGPNVNNEEAKEPITVWVEDVQGGQPWIRLGDNTLPSFEALAQALTDLRGENSLVVVDGPPQVTVQTIAMALDAARKADIPAMTVSAPRTNTTETGRVRLIDLP